MEEPLQYKDLRDEGIPYSRNWLAELIKRGLFPRGRRFVPGGRRHWTRSEIQAAKELAAKAADEQAA